MCNSLFIIQQRLRSSERPTGLQEQDIFTIANQWVGNPPDLAAKLQADLTALRALPEVVDAYVSNSYPLSNGGWDDGIMMEPGDAHWAATGALYFADEHMGLPTLGLKLVSGRNFEPAEIIERNDMEGKAPAALIVSQALATKLFPTGDALGKSIYLSNYKQKSPIIGIVERLQQPWTSIGNKRVEFAMLQPFRYVAHYSHYVVRAKPGQIETAMKERAEKQSVGTRTAPGSMKRRAPCPRPGGALYQDDPHRSRDHIGRGKRGSANRHGIRNHRHHQFLGFAEATADRHPPGDGRDADRHPAIFSNREPHDRHYRRDFGSSSRARLELLDGR